MDTPSIGITAIGYALPEHAVDLRTLDERGLLDSPVDVLAQFGFTGNRSTWTYGFEPKDAKTRVTLKVDSDVPQNMVARYASQGTLEKMNQERAAEALSNLKGLLEE